MVIANKKPPQKKPIKTRVSKSVNIENNENKSTNIKDVSEIIIILKDINASEILSSNNDVIIDDEEDEYSKDILDEEDNIQETLIEFNKDDVTIGNLLHEKSKKSKRSIMFLDPHRCKIKFWGTMSDLTLNGPLPRYTNNPCWWCRNKFSSHPIGCPIRYNYQKNSGIDKERIEEVMTDLNLSLETGNDFFETEGMFCTFPCVKAYIIDQIARTKSSTYRKALTLLTLLYFKLIGTLENIPIAGTWKLTTDWGGHMSPLEFRASNGILEYTETVNTKRPYMFCSSNLIKEKRLV